MKIQGQKLSLATKLESAARCKDSYSSNRIYEMYILNLKYLSKPKLILAVTLAAYFQSNTFFLQLP